MPPVHGTRPVLPLPPGAANHVSTIGRTAPPTYVAPLLDPLGAAVIVHFSDSDEDLKEPDVPPKAAPIDQQPHRPKPRPLPVVGKSKLQFAAQKAVGGPRQFPKPASNGGTPPLQGVPAANEIENLRLKVRSMGLCLSFDSPTCSVWGQCAQMCLCWRYAFLRELGGNEEPCPVVVMNDQV